MPFAHRIEAGADVCSTEHRVGQLSPPLLESGWNDFDAVCFLAYPGGRPVSLRRNHESIFVVWPHDKRQTDRPVAIPTHWLASHESAKTIDDKNVLHFWLQL